MESEKVKNIKETIQETIDGKLSNKYLTICEISCCPILDIDKLFADILTLINELESENKRLQDLCNKTYEDLTKEIDRLEKETKQLKQFAERLKESLNDMEYRAKTGRKTLRIEEVYEQMNWILHKVVQSKIDEIAKEMGVEL